MLVKCTPSAHRRGYNCLPNKQSANLQTIRLRLSQPTLFDWMKHLFFGKYSIVFFLLFAFSIQQSWGQCTSADFPTAICQGSPGSPAFSLALDESGTATISVSDINNGSFDGNCGIFSLALSQTNFDCGDVGNVPITLIVTNNYTDAMGNHPNQNTCNTSITIMDNLLPIITCPATDVVTCPATTVPSNAAATTDVATATDNCGLAIAPVAPVGFSGPLNSFFYYSDNTTTSPVAGECSMIERTWRVYDTSGNFSECIQMIEVNDNSAPVIDFNSGVGGIQSVPGPITVNCTNIPAPPANVQAIDNCGLSIGTTNPLMPTQVTSPTVADPNQNACYTITRTWTATNTCGQTTSFSQVITVNDVSAPTLANVPDLTYNTANGACTTANINYTYSGAVADNCFNPATQLIRAFDVRDAGGNVLPGFVGLGHQITNLMLPVGSFTFNFYATDPCGNLGQETVNVTVNDTEDPVPICSTGSISAEINGDTNISDLLDGVFSVTDNCSAIADISIAYECSGGGAGGIAPACTTVGCADIGNPVTVDIVVTDESGNDASCSIIINVLDGAPQCVANPITVMLDATGNYTLTGTIPNPAMGTDLDNIDGSSDDCGGMTEIVSISQSMFTCADAAMPNGQVMITLTVEDDAMPMANESSCMGIITVLDKEDPMAVCQDVFVQIDGNSNPMLDNVTYEANSMSTYSPIAGTGTALTLIDDDVSAALPVGFNFTFFGTDYDEFYVYSNGFIDFSGTAPPATTAFNPNVIAFALADLNPSCTGAAVRYFTTGTAPNRQLVVNFTNVCNGANRVTAQLVLSEGSDLIEIHTANCATTGMIGIEDGMGTNLTQACDRYVSFTPQYGALFNGGSTDNCPNLSFSLNADLGNYDCDDLALFYTIRSNNNRYRRRNFSNNGNIFIDDIPVMGTPTEMEYSSTADAAYIFSNDGVSNFITQFNPITGDIIGTPVTTAIGANGTIEAAEVINGLLYVSTSSGAFGRINLSNGNVTIINGSLGMFTGLAYDGTALYAVDGGGVLYDLNVVLTPTFSVSVTSLGAVPDVMEFDGFEFGPFGEFIAKGTAISSGNQRLFVVDVDNVMILSSTGGINFVTGLLTHTPAPMITLTATDNSNNDDMCNAAVILEDMIPPVANCKNISVSLDVNGDAEIEATDLDDSSTDNCGIVRYRIDQSMFLCALGPVTVELEVMDKSGNTDTESCTVTVVDDIAPNLNCPSTVQIPLNQNGNGILNTSTATAQDNCGAATITYSQSAFTCSDVMPSPFAVTATATDGTNSISCSFQVTVVDNIAPVLTCPSTATIACLAEKDVAGIVPMATATDNCPNPVVTQVMPDVELTTAQVNALNPNACRGFRRTFSAVDTSMNAATNCNFNILLIDNIDPTLESDPFDPTAPSATAGVGGVLQEISCENVPTNDEMIPVFVDNDGDANCEVTLGAANIQLIQLFDTPGCPYVTTRRYRATDACGNTFVYRQEFRVIDNVDPEFDTGVVNTLVVDVNSGQCFASNVTALNFTNLASDNCTSFGNLTKGFTVTATGAMMAINSSMTSLNASNFNYPVGEYTVVYTVEDACGNDDTHTVSFTVEDNTIPIADCKAFKNITLDNNGNATLSPGDFDDGGTSDACGFTLTLNPASLDCSHIDGANLPTPVPVTLIVTDPSGNVNTCVTTVNLSLPVTTVNCPNNLTVDCSVEDYTDLAITGMPIIDTPCSNFTTSFIPIVDTEMNVSATSAFCWEVTRTFNLSVTDPMGNSIFSSTCVQTINLIDNEDPVFDNMPAGGNIACINELPGAAVVTASDPNSCLGGTPVVTTSDNLLTPCTQITRTYTATDECGNTETFAQTFMIVNDKPVIDFGAASPFNFDNDAGDCGAIVNIDFSQYVTDCSDYDDLVITITDQSSGAVYIENDVNGLGNPITTNDFNGSFFPVGEYDFDIAVIDPCGSTDMETFTMYVQDNQAPSLSCDPTQIVDIDQTGVLNLSDVFDGATDNCGTVTSTEFAATNAGQVAANGQSITFTQADAGNTYNIIINATDDAIDQATGGADANSNACDVLVTVVGNQITLFAAGVNSPIIASPSATPQTVEVPVTVENFDFIEGFSFTYNLTNPVSGNIAQFVGITDINSTLGNNGNLNANVSGPPMNQIFVTYAVTSGSGTISLGTATLFKVIVLIDDAAAIGDVVDLEINGMTTPLEISQNTSGVSVTITNPTLVDGEIEIAAPVAMVNLSGNVSNDQNIGIEGVELQITNTNSSMTDMNGDYSEQIVQGTAITVDPEFNPPINIFTRVNLFDANAIQSHAGGFPLLADLPDWIAADVNGGGTITISDVVQIVKLNLGITNEYPNSVDSWEFIPTSDVLTQPAQHFVVPTHTETRSYTSAETQNNVTAADFLALEMGNVTPSGDQALMQMMDNPTVAMEAATRSNQLLTLITRDQFVKKGQMVPLEFRANNFNELIGFVLDMNFNPSLLKFVDVLDSDLSDWSVDNYSINEVENGRLPIAWLAKNATTLSEDEIVFTLLFEAQTDLASLENTMHLSYERMPTYAGTKNDEVLPVELNFDNGQIDNLDNGFSLFQNRPNPFKNATTIGFNLPKATTATLRITDISGKTIKLIEANYEAGYHEIELKNLDATGVLFYELKTPNYQLTKRMVLLE